MKPNRSFVGRQVSVACLSLGVVLAISGTTACATDPTEASAESEAAISVPCPGRYDANATAPLTQAEWAACLGDTLARKIVDDAKDEACLAACVLSGPFYPACASACGIAGVADGVLNTMETYYCLQEQKLKRPIKLECPAQNGNPNVTSVGCNQAGGFGAQFDPGLAFAACRNTIGGWDAGVSNWYDTRNWTCAEVLRSPLTFPSATTSCNNSILACVENTRLQCGGAPAGGGAPPAPVPVAVAVPAAF